MKKKIGMFSGVMMIIGSSVGAGIFLKSNEILQNTGSIFLSIIAWVIGLFTIFCLAMCLTELSEGAGEKNKEGFLGWIKTFNNNFLYRGCKNFMSYVYLPLNIFAMPLYAVQIFSDAFGVHPQWWIVSLIALIIMIYFLITSCSVRIVNIQNLLVTFIKFIPLTIAIGIGFVYIALGNKPSNNFMTTNHIEDSSPSTFVGLNPYVGIFMSIPSILFVMDGFYSATAFQSSLEQPKKMGKIMFIGLSILTVVYLLIAISLMLGPNSGGGINIFKGWLPNWLFITINILIGIGILGIVNAFCVHMYSIFEDMYQKQEFNWFSKIKTIPTKATLSLLVINISVFIVLICGGYFFLDIYAYQDSGWDRHMAGIFSMSDLVANWTALFAFLFITFSIVGGLWNRKTKKVKVQKTKGFVVCGIITCTMMILSTLFLIVGCFYDLISSIIFYFYNHSGGITVIGNFLSTLILLIFFAVIFLSPLIKKNTTNSKNI